MRRARRGATARHASWFGDIVLLVTDDAALRRTVTRALSAQGMRPLTKDVTARVEQMVTRMRLSAVLFDLDPIDDERWHDVARLRDATRATRWSTLSATTDALERLRDHVAPADVHVDKPISTALLLAALSRPGREP